MAVLLLLTVLLQNAPLPPVPDFGGEWVIDTHRSKHVGVRQGSYGLNPKLTLRIYQTDETLRVERSMGGPVQTFTYWLDGRETNAVEPLGRGSAGRHARQRTRWDGEKLVTTITTKGASSSVTEIRYLEGDAMVVEREGGYPPKIKYYWTRRGSARY